MEKIVNKKTSIFKENKLQSKIAKITFMFIAILCITNNSFANNNETVKIPIKYKSTKPVVSLYCQVSYSNCYTYDNREFNSSTAPAVFMHGDSNYFCGERTETNVFVGCKSKNVYKHEFPDGTTMYSNSSDPNHFKYKIENLQNNTNLELDVMDLLKAMPEIGISRVDPNLIEY